MLIVEPTFELVTLAVNLDPMVHARADTTIPAVNA